MKKVYISIGVPIIICVFLLCFAIGRAIAIKDSGEQQNKEENTQIKEDVVSPASSNAEKVAKPAQKEQSNNQDIYKKNKENVNTPPDRMLFPCGEEILVDYSQDAIYSKTMDDWRAHMGIDYKAEPGENISSVWDGTVRNVYKDMLWGYTVEILHDGELVSVYKNLDEKITVKKGDKVRSGQVIGKVGDSAAVETREAPHLHFELWTGGEPINPHSYIY